MSPAMATTPTMRHFIKVKVDRWLFLVFFKGKNMQRKKANLLMFVCTTLMQKYMKLQRNDENNLSDSMHV